MNHLTSFLDDFFPRRVIVNCDREPYLYRWFLIRTAPIALFFHRFVRSDEDRALHDHPWPFIVIPLWGGYIEHSDRVNCYGERVSTQRRVWPIISTRFRSTDYRHRVELINGRHSWSLFIRFRKTREWGFWPATGFILWNKWWDDKCE